MPKAKLFLIVGAHVLAVIGVLCLLWVTRYPILTQELFTADAAKSYEESNAFADSVTNANYNILDEIRYQTLYDTDGKYDPDKIVDVAKYEDTGEITGKDETGLSFRLGDLYSWGKLISESMTDYDAARSKLDKQDCIIVCKRSDGIYHYFHYKDFKQMIDYGELSFVITGDSSADDILTELKQGEYQESNSGESRFRGLQDIDGKIAYINCWNYDGERVVGDYKTVNGETVLQLVNNSKEWNGKLNEAYRMINNSAETIYSDVDNYAVAQNQYQEGNTNITYLYVNLDNKTVITNKKKYQNFDNYKENLKKMKKSGKYVIVRPKLADYESNIEKAGKGDSMAQKWQETVAGYVDASDYIYASVVDTAYPVKDNFYEQDEIFTRYGAGAKVAGILGMAAVAAYLVILVFLTIGAGKVKEDEEVYLMKFDHIKTELAAASVLLLWAVVALVGVKAGAFTWQNASGETIYMENVESYLPGIVVGSVEALYTCAMFLFGYLSLVRRIKAGTVWKNSVLRWLLIFVKEMFQNIRHLWKSIMEFAIFFMIHWLTYVFGSAGSSIWISNRLWAVILLIIDVAAFIWMVQKAKGTGKIKTGIEKIAGGEVDYQIPVNGLLAEHKEIAEKVNSIGEGLEAALAKSMKSERLKTDLITNVSHDIKTPLTSIINYVELLKQEDLKDPKIQRYIEVLEQKSQRLKTLTEDVVEASKVSSGNITLEFMNLNLVEMIQQTSGEFEEKGA